MLASLLSPLALAAVSSAPSRSATAPSHRAAAPSHRAAAPSHRAAPSRSAAVPSRGAGAVSSLVAAAPSRGAGAVSSLVAAALAAGASGCLVLSPPEYEEPPQTAPFLMSPSPSTIRPLYIDDNDELVQFGANVVSEDNGEPVWAALYIDYGVMNSEGHPYRRSIFPKTVAEAGKLSDGLRPIVREWYLGVTNVPDGYCHTVTLMASHAFNECQCPVDKDDMSSLTWQIIHCNPNDPDCPTACPPLDCGDAPCASCTDPELGECASL